MAQKMTHFAPVTHNIVHRDTLSAIFVELNQFNGLEFSILLRSI